MLSGLALEEPELRFQPDEKLPFQPPAAFVNVLTSGGGYGKGILLVPFFFFPFFFFPFYFFPFFVGPFAAQMRWVATGRAPSCSLGHFFS